MRIVANAGREDIALVYVAETEKGKFIEFVESVQPPIPREQKWVLIVSTLFGCPVGCKICDCGSHYGGKLSRDEILFQIDYLVTKRFPDRRIPVGKFKVQFARMGEPSFNHNVLDVLESLTEIYDAPGLIPSISTIAPNGADNFLEKLLEIKRRKFPKSFQFQFSIQTTDEKLRDWLIPAKKWSFSKMAKYGNRFFDIGGRKIALNFALADGMPIEPDILLQHFSPDIFLIKITPVNPTYRANMNNISSVLTSQKWNEIVRTMQTAGYEVILSIGELEENRIGSNCGQYVTAYRQAQAKVEGGYSYELQRLQKV